MVAFVWSLPLPSHRTGAVALKLTFQAPLNAHELLFLNEGLGEAGLCADERGCAFFISLLLRHIH